MNQAPHTVNTCQNCRSRLTDADISRLTNIAKQCNMRFSEMALMCGCCDSVQRQHQAQYTDVDEGGYETAESFARDWLRDSLPKY